MQPVVDRQAIEQLAKVFGFAAASHVVLLLGLINKDSRGQSGTFWSRAGLKDGSYFDLPIDIPLALVFLLLHGHTASPQASHHPIQFDIEPLDALLLTRRGLRAHGSGL